MTLSAVAATSPGIQGALRLKHLQMNALDNQRLARVHGHPQAIGTATTSTNDTGEVVDLLTVGDDELKFLDNTFYKVVLRHFAASTQNIYFQETEQWVRGRNTAGADPVLFGDVRVINSMAILNGTMVQFGRVKLKAVVASGATAETTDGTTSSGTALGAFTSGAAALTFPVSRTATLIGANYSADTFGATTGGVAHVAALAAAGTGTFQTAASDDGLVDTNPADGIAYLEMDITPPVNAFLSMNGTPDPGELEVHVLGVSSVAYDHYVEVFVSEGIYWPLKAA